MENDTKPSFMLETFICAEDGLVLKFR